ncbi:unnamed protein product [Orchesella dallaii]|uniref:Uncharacterized protein n=1 Tax=Orchesella dallaii TaxID=48710 RepID=A0ABP1RTA8_9HEXA
MKKITVKEFVVIFVIYYIQTVASRTKSLDINKIDLRMKLRPFRECSVNIISMEAELQNTVINKYSLIPLDFPVIQSEWWYQQRKARFKNERYLHCNKAKIRLKNSNVTYFLAPPQYNLHCFVQILIQPLLCYTMLSRLAAPISPSKDVLAVTPPSFWTSIFDYRLPTTHHLRSYKRGLMFIHVQHWIAEHEAPKYYDSMFYVVNSFLKSVQPVELQNIPVQFLFLLRFLKTRFVVASVTFPYCSDYVNLYLQVLKTSRMGGKKDKHMTELYLKYALVEEIDFRKRSDVDISKHTSWKDIEKTGTHCPLNVFLYDGVETIKPRRSFYLHSWMNLGKQKSSEMDSIFVQLLCPNCTAVPDVESLLQFYAIFPSFKRHYTEMYLTTNLAITTSGLAVHFLLCSPLKKQGFLSLLGYVSAFDEWTWIALLLACLVSWHICEKMQTLGFFYLFQMLGILLNQGITFKRVRWIYGSWFLAGFVIAYFYQGDNINRLTAPLEPAKMERFDEVLRENLTIFSPPASLTYVQQSYNLMLAMEFKYFFVYTAEQTLFGSQFYMKTLSLSPTKVESYLKMKMHVPTNFTDVGIMIQPNYYLNIITKCDGSVYVDVIENIRITRMSLLNRGISENDITVSKESYSQINEEFDLESIPLHAGYFIKRVHSLIQSGILELWKEWDSRVTGWNETVLNARNQKSSGRPISTEDNVVVVFYIHAGLLSLAAVIFVLEIRGIILGVLFAVKSFALSLLERYSDRRIFIIKGYVYLVLLVYYTLSHLVTKAGMEALRFLC